MKEAVKKRVMSRLLEKKKSWHLSVFVWTFLWVAVAFISFSITKDFVMPSITGQVIGEVDGELYNESVEVLEGVLVEEEVNESNESVEEDLPIG